jgi:hypothetical protein
MTLEMTPPSVAARPLRLRPTLAGATVAFAFGSLSLGSMCAVPDDMVARVGAGGFWILIGAIWVAMAACIYGANQAWIGRDRIERGEVFLLCLGIAFVLFFVALVFVATVSWHVGWRP